jgi:hypothetical protein
LHEALRHQLAAVWFIFGSGAEVPPIELAVSYVFAAAVLVRAESVL